MADGDLNTALESIRHRDEGRAVQSWQARGRQGRGVSAWCARARDSWCVDFCENFLIRRISRTRG